MSEYVPGPWRVSSDGRYVAVLGKDYQIVANVLGEPRTEHAQLISAAPDLLEAAKGLLEYIGPTPFSGGGIQLLALQQAIDKAEGRL